MNNIDRVLFDATLVSLSEVVADLFLGYFLWLIFLFVAVLLFKKSKEKKGKIIDVKWFLIAGVGLETIGLLFVLFGRLATYSDLESCLPFEEGKCNSVSSKVLEAKKGHNRGTLTTDKFSVSVFSEGGMWLTLGREILSEIEKGDCLFTIHSNKRMEKIYYAGIANCEY